MDKQMLAFPNLSTQFCKPLDSLVCFLFGCFF